ncbi:hypothetical protein I4U23_018993 [Adineta vaga]|nr:hypothetical protein I4U23_018993 [Adineta vaga]
MILFTLIIFFAGYKQIISQSWNVSDGILPWEVFVQLADTHRPLGLVLNQTSLVHHHFAIGYFCLHSFMYDEAQEAFNMAIELDPTFIEAYIGKMLTCKQTLGSYTNFDCGLSVYNNISTIPTKYNIVLSPLQSSLIETVHHWYANQSSIAAGELAFLAAIENVSVTYPNETDIQVLWGLSLLNVAFQRQYEGQMEPEPMIKARAVLKTALTNEPTHPGALHYIIRAYDVANNNISANAIDYVTNYEKLPSALSHSNHVPALIWMRTGSIISAKSADETSLRNSLTLCLMKIMGRNVSISSLQLSSALAQLNSTTQIQTFLQCDTKNRATATEWLSFSRLQTGNWQGTLTPINDLYFAYNQSVPPSNLYLSYAYRTRARAVINIFYWLPYDSQFVTKANEVQQLHDTLDFIASSDNITDWDISWSEAGYRLSSCLRLLTNINTTYTDSSIKPMIDEHLARFAVLANQTAPLNTYISVSISLMINQVQGIISYKNNLFQECLNTLREAAKRESELVTDNNSPTLIYARSSELLAMHLLLLHRKYIESTITTNFTILMFNDTLISVSQFPLFALDLYESADISAPNRAANILGMARANSQLRYNNAAERLYQKLLDQISSSNNSDPIFAQEATNFLAQKTELTGLADKKQFCFYSIVLSLFFIIFA